MAKRKQQQATMNDVAALAGVSQATVSLVLNSLGTDRFNDRFTEATQVRVMNAVEKLGYRTNAFAKGLRSGESDIIGFVSDEVATAPFAGRLLKGAQEAAWLTGTVILSIDTFGDPDLERAAIEKMLSYRARGIVYASMYHRILDIPDLLDAVPTVVANAQDRAGVRPSVFPDERQGGHDATRHLLEAGHERIAFINIQPADSELPAGIGRFEGFRDALAEAGRELDPELVRYGYGVVEDGLAFTLELMELPDPPTAIFCANDRTAWGSYRALASLGASIPQDCTIIGFDDQETLAPYLDPGLTTMRLPFEQMGRRSVEILLNGDGAEGRREPIQCSLVQRGSVTTAKVPA